MGCNRVDFFSLVVVVEALFIASVLVVVCDGRFLLLNVPGIVIGIGMGWRLLFCVVRVLRE